MPVVDCWQSIYAVHDDGSIQRSKVQGRVSRAKREHGLSISLMKCNVVTYVRATGEIRFTLHDHFKGRCKSWGQKHSDGLRCYRIERTIEVLCGEVQVDFPVRV